jgi:hypothetical protein
MKKILILFPVILLLLASTGHAETLWQASVSLEDLNDQRTFSHQYYNPPSSRGGLGGYWPYSFKIGWDISYDMTTALWTYEYTLTARKKSISHFILEVSDSATEESFHDVMINGSPADFEGPAVWGRRQGKSNIGIPADIYGIKFDGGGKTVTYSFTTELDPVWGNFYAKSGKDKGKWVYAYNKALKRKGFESMNELYFIPRPDGGSNPPIVPEPISYVLFIIGSAMLGGKLYLKKRKTARI